MRFAARWIVVVSLAAVAVATDVRPGWLGFGFRYHQGEAGRRGGTGWLLVEHVTDGGPASEAGLRVRDVIVRIDDKPSRFASDVAVLEWLSRVREGKRVTLTVRRADRTLRVTLLPRRMSDQQFLTWQRNFDLARRRARER